MQTDPTQMPEMAKQMLLKGTSVEQTAKQLGYSANQFREIFKKHFGFSPSQFLHTARRKKMEEIMALIKEGKSVSFINKKMGFAFSNYLRVAFKKRFGVYPSKIQKEVDAVKIQKAYYMLTEQKKNVTQISKELKMPRHKLVQGIKEKYNIELDRQAQNKLKNIFLPALELLKTGKTVKEVATIFGYKTVTGFSVRFKRYIGILPLLVKSPNRSLSPLMSEQNIEQVKELLKTAASVQDVSNQMGYASLGSFSKTFKKITNITPLEFKNAYRAEEGRRLLLSENKTIEETARCLGYENTFQFVKIYKHHHGVTPAFDIRKKRAEEKFAENKKAAPAPKAPVRISKETAPIQIRKVEYLKSLKKRNR